MKKIDILYAILFAFLSGSTFIAAKYTVIEIPCLLSLSIRSALTALILLPFAQRPAKINFMDIYISGILLGVLCLGLLYYAISLKLDTSLTSIIVQLNIPISVILARYILKEHFTPGAMIGIITALIGICFIVGAPSFNGDYFAFILVAFSSFFLAMFNIQIRKLKSLEPISLLCWINLIAAPHLFIMSYYLEGNPFDFVQRVTLIPWLALAYTIVFSSIVGVKLWIYLLQKYPVYMVSPYSLLAPFFGVSLAILMLGESPTWSTIIGGLITLLGVFLSQVKNLPFISNNTNFHN